MIACNEYPSLKGLITTNLDLYKVNFEGNIQPLIALYKELQKPEIKELAGTKYNVSYISFSRNFGQVPAIIAGLQRVKGNGAIVMSADLQDPPELIAKMIEAVEIAAIIAIAKFIGLNLYVYNI